MPLPKAPEIEKEKDDISKVIMYHANQSDCSSKLYFSCLLLEFQDMG